MKGEDKRGQGRGWLEFWVKVKRHPLGFLMIRSRSILCDNCGYLIAFFMCV